MEGLRHTIGLVSRRNTVAKEDADVVKVMRGAGGIPLAVTNVPELGMWYETWCTVHGQTFNPYDTTRTTGGSSGGEYAADEMNDLNFSDSKKLFLLLLFKED
ncbi:hypothetical protein J437_LFUL005575 [Ladona fulva]|uniref:Amidase domain-containing protein n=1 Tax=Ladona fulva TaxID=123851 RepID=A0A8K0JXX7_LADFU|nr:hypothetical protein J437_LFUL005575 [Ladona fulva]